MSVARRMVKDERQACGKILDPHISEEPRDANKRDANRLSVVDEPEGYRVEEGLVPSR